MSEANLYNADLRNAILSNANLVKNTSSDH
ncbi:MAG: hypothetical protein F6K36_16090 [Symploca sp. SIO3C6]|uniref:Pentapeptide repeat-containing protein n=1 Tax=Symploca sp. SIO1C4 TaxID=2607765 RepID=A0A6B3NI01_9CYAN|nr:hypothetical protein [Symploca sp. SIO3C6]NER31377.1 hypothetical protein [Symploca sp. SIO1C4]NET05845.1 hypothetical protein [Symploca sp. SIO2B6]